MKTGDLIFVKGKSPIDRAIEYFDDGPFNHVCMVMPYGTITESQFIVNTRDIPNPYTDDEIVVLDIGLTDNERQKLVIDHFAYLSYQYDLKQIFGILLHDLFGFNTNKTWINKNQLICSRYMVNLCLGINYFTNRGYHYDVNYLTPNSLYRVLSKLKDTQPIAN